MKSASILFAIVAATILFLSDISLKASGRSALVSTSVSSERWLRTCSYLAPEGLLSIEVDAAERCPAAGPPSRQPAAARQAMLER